MKLFGKEKNKQHDFEVMIKDFNAVLYKHALWMTGRKDLASDIVQETYYQAWNSIHTLKDEEKALPWLLTILRRVVYSEQRCQYRQTETLEELAQCNEETQGDAATLLDIYTALEKVSSNHRDVFLLRHLHGFSYQEISAQLNIPEGTVMSRLARARDALKSVLNVSNGQNIIPFGSQSKEYSSHEK